MAAAMSTWAKQCACASDSEQNVAVYPEQHSQDRVNDNSSGGGETTFIPSLAAAEATATKTRNEKPQTLSFQESATYEPSQPATAECLTRDKMSAFFTGPCQRSAEELDRSKLGRGFKYSGSYPERSARNEQPRGRGRFNMEYVPLRADECDNWHSNGAAAPFGTQKHEKRWSFGWDSGNGGADAGRLAKKMEEGRKREARADKADNWRSNRASAPFETQKHEKRWSFGWDSSNGGADTGRLAKKMEEGRKGEEGGSGIGGRPTLPGGEGTCEGIKGENGAHTCIFGHQIGNTCILREPLTWERERELMMWRREEDSAEIEFWSNLKLQPGDDPMPWEIWKDWKEKEIAKIQEAGTGSTYGQAEKGIWSRNGNERLQQGNRTESSSRKPESVDSPPRRYLQFLPDNWKPMKDMPTIPFRLCSTPDANLMERTIVRDDLCESAEFAASENVDTPFHPNTENLWGEAKTRTDFSIIGDTCIKRSKEDVYEDAVIDTKALSEVIPMEKMLEKAGIPVAHIVDHSSPEKTKVRLWEEMCNLLCGQTGTRIGDIIVKRVSYDVTVREMIEAMDVSEVPHVRLMQWVLEYKRYMETAGISLDPSLHPDGEKIPMPWDKKYSSFFDHHIDLNAVDIGPVLRTLDTVDEDEDEDEVGVEDKGLIIINREALAQAILMARIMENAKISVGDSVNFSSPKETKTRLWQKLREWFYDQTCLEIRDIPVQRPRGAKARQRW